MKIKFLNWADKWLMTICFFLIVTCLAIMAFSSINGYSWDTNPTITYTYFLFGMAGGFCFPAKAIVQSIS